MPGACPAAINGAYHAAMNTPQTPHAPYSRRSQEIAPFHVMSLLARVTRAVGEVFPNEGMSLWHSIGEAAFQEVPHLHFHVHPRRLGDGVLQVYPQLPSDSDPEALEAQAGKLRDQLRREGG